MPTHLVKNARIFSGATTDTATPIGDILISGGRIAALGPDLAAPAGAEVTLADAVDGFCEGIAFSPDQIARVFDKAKALGLPVKLHADQLSNLHGAALAARLRRAVGRSSRIYRRGRRRRDGRGRHGRRAAARRVLFHPRDEEAAGRRCSASGRAMALATDNNPGTSPLTSLLLAMNMAATLFGMTVEECLAGVTREAARRSALPRDRHAGGRQAGRSRHLGHRAPGGTRLPHGLQPARIAAHGREPVHDHHSTPGRHARRAGEAIYWNGENARLDPAAAGRPRRRACAEHRAGGTSRSMASIPASANSRASRSRPTIGHAAAQPHPVALLRRRRADARPCSARLIMALKLMSLGRGASGVRPNSCADRGDAGGKGVVPVIPEKARSAHRAISRRSPI
jgi:hypothetical protein